MKKFMIVLLMLLAFTLSACYHARIQTGMNQSNYVVEKKFASCWLYGMIPPNEVQTTGLCRNGVAVVETEQSFLNLLVSGLTLGIYTPMHIKVTCASSQK